MRQAFRDWREWRRFQAVPRAERRIVFLSESHQDWHHFAPVVKHLTGPLGETLLYVASDQKDEGLRQDPARVRPFCVGQGLARIWFCQFLDADVLVTQILDLGNLQLKRSIHQVHYVHQMHSLVSTHRTDHANSYDHYDTILCGGPHHVAEIRRREELKGLPAKQLVPHGYGRVDELLAQGREPPPPGPIHVLLAPSWGPDSILPVCGLALTTTLLEAGFRVTLRPHFQTRWTTPEVIDRIVAACRDRPGFRLVEQMGESDSLFDSHLMISDWSGAALDYGLGLEKPVLFIDVPPKARNDEWPALGIEPFESLARGRLGAVLHPDRIADAPDTIRRLVGDRAGFRQAMQALRDGSIFNVGRSGVAGAEAIQHIARQVAGRADGG